MAWYRAGQASCVHDARLKCEMQIRCAHDRREMLIRCARDAREMHVRCEAVGTACVSLSSLNCFIWLAQLFHVWAQPACNTTISRKLLLAAHP